MSKRINLRNLGLVCGFATALLSFSAWTQIGKPEAPAKAVSTTANGRLKLKDLIQTALENNQELKAVQANQQIKESRIGPAGALEDPMLNVDAMNFPADNFKANESEMTGVQVGLSQKLPFPGKRGKLSEAAQKQSAASGQRIKQKEFDVASQVTQLYFDLYLSFQKKSILESQKALVGQILAVSRSQYSLNKIPQAAVLNLQVEEVNLIEELLRLESEIKHQQSELLHQIGHLPNHELLGQPEPLVKSKFESAQWTEDKIAQAVIEHNFELNGIRKELESSDAMVSYAKKGYLPDFELRAAYMFRKPSLMDEQGKDFVSAGLGISIPLWAGSKQSEEVKGAVAERSKAQAELENARLMLSHQARATFAELKEAQRRIALFETGLLQLTKQAVASGKSAYLTGRMDYASLLEALRTQYRTELSYQEALAKFEVQLSRLEALLGQSLRGPL